MTEWWMLAGAGLALVALLLIVTVFLVSKRRVLRADARRRIREVWILTERVDDPARRVLEADKILDTALSFLGYSGTLGEKLKKAGPRFSDVNGVWKAHKLRNSVAHDMHVRVSEAQAKQAMIAFKKALHELGM